MRRRYLHSLQRRLLVVLLLPLVVLALVGAALDYNTAKQMTGESHDRVLASTAVGLAARLETDRDNDLPAHLLATVRAVGRATPQDELSHLVVDGHGGLVSGDLQLATLANTAAIGNPAFLDSRLNGKPVRAVRYLYEGPDGRATIVVAETLIGRTDAARRILLLTMVTNLGMILAVVIVATLAVQVAMRPLHALGHRVEGHEVRELRPIALRGIATETRPLVRALNRLMARVRQTASARQAFINSTAHQLRTPLAGLSAEVGLLAGQAMPPELNERVRDVQRSVQRLSHLTNQMLALARASGEAESRRQVETVELSGLLQHVASACLDAALARGADLGFEQSPASVQGSPWMLRELLLNLVNNAITHTPEGTHITVRCGMATGEAFLEVEDDGPGIAAAHRERVFERFVRLADAERQGSGLGLSIVREIAGRHGASVLLSEGAGGHGTRVRVQFPHGPTNRSLAAEGALSAS